MYKNLMQRFALICVLFSGCSPLAVSLPESDSTPPVANYGQSFDANSTGSIAGVVQWTGHKPTIEPMYRPIGSTFQKEPIANPNAVEIGNSGGIANAVVILRGVPLEKAKPWPHGSVEVELHERGITVHQDGRAGRVGFVLRGDSVVIRTTGEKLFGVRVRGAAFFLQILPPSQPHVKRTLHQNGVVQLTSASGQYWAAAELIVSDHPYVALTDNAGRFRIDQVPSGQFEAVISHPNWRIAATETDPETGMLVRMSYATTAEKVVRITVKPKFAAETQFQLGLADFSTSR